MKRFLVQVDQTKSVKRNESVNANVLSIAAGSTETTRCSDEIEISTDATGVDFTNRPDGELLLQAGREFGTRVRYPQKQ
jgi:hypothetical protein